MLSMLFVMYMFYSLTFVVSKQNLLYAQPFFLTASRMVASGFLLFAFLAFNKRGRLSVPKGVLKELALITIFGIFITNAFEFWGLNYLDPTRACFLFCLTPFATSILSFFYLKEKISRKKGIGLLIGFAGAAWVIILDVPCAGESNSSGTLVFPEMAVVVASCSTAFSWIVLRKLLKHYNSGKEGFSLVALNAHSMALGGALLAILSLITEDWSPIPVGSVPPFLGWLTITLLISNVIAYNLYAYLLKFLTASFISFIGFLTPFMTAFYQWIFFGKSLTLEFIVGACLTSVGLFIFYREEIALGYIIRSSKVIQ